MVDALDCIEDGAVSLDGGIIRENRALSIGYGYISFSLFLSVSIWWLLACAYLVSIVHGSHLIELRGCLVQLISPDINTV